MPAYDQVKVWTVDPTPPARPRSPRHRLSGAERGPRRFDESRDRSGRNEKLGVWARLLVVAILGGAILWWPYGRNCGVGLASYMTATSMITIGGLWVVACTWIQRMARTHAVAMLVALWGVGLLALEVMPRIGYARADPAHPVSWLCGS